MSQSELTFRVTYVGDAGDAVVDESLPESEPFTFPRGAGSEAAFRGAIGSESGERRAVLQALYRELVLSNFVRLNGRAGRPAERELDAAFPDTGALPGFQRLSGKYNAAGAILYNAKVGRGAGYRLLPAVLDALIRNRILEPPRCPLPVDSRDPPGPAVQHMLPLSDDGHSFQVNPVTPAAPPSASPERWSVSTPTTAFHMMQQPEPQSLSFSVLMNDVQTGGIKIPQFQRDFVWTREKSAKLLDSILKGYPIGTFIFWKTRERLRTVRNIGSAQLPDTPEGDFVQHVLDGQQRLTSLFASVRGLKVPRGDRLDDFSHLYIDLSANDDQDLVLTDASAKPADSVIRIVDLIKGDFIFLGNFPQQYHERLQAYKRRLESYIFSVVLVKDAPIEVATEIFTRINVTGKPLSVFEIMVAKTFDSAVGFDLAERVDHVMAQLADVDYDSVRPETILQAVAVILKGECQTKEILRLEKQAFIKAWPVAVDSLCTAVDYFRDRFQIPAARLLPFTPLLVPFTYFFAKHPNRPTGDAQRFLEDFFWRVALTGRYSSSLEGKLAQDVKKIDGILGGRLPEYDTGVDLSPSFIRANGHFRTSRSYARALLCLLAQQRPRSFNDGSYVRISNDWLKQANSKNYHHFFPRAYLRRRGYDDSDANQVANITIVDDHLNKHVIRDRAPSDYLKPFRYENRQFRETMASHLIDADASAVWDDDYEQFIQARYETFSQELQKRIIPQPSDRQGQVALEDETEDEAA